MNNCSTKPSSYYPLSNMSILSESPDNAQQHTSNTLHHTSNSQQHSPTDSSAKSSSVDIGTVGAELLGNNQEVIGGGAPENERSYMGKCEKSLPVVVYLSLILV